MSRFINKHVINEVGLKMAGFFYHCVMTTSVHMHVYCYPLYESRTKQVCEHSLYIEMIFSI